MEYSTWKTLSRVPFTKVDLKNCLIRTTATEHLLSDPFVTAVSYPVN